MLLLTTIASAQTYTLPDTNLRNALLQRYPTVMSGNDLDTVAAKQYAGPLDLNNCNIINADGIQFFDKIVALNLNFNKLTSLPDLSRLKSALSVYAANNQLTTLPDLNTLTTLIDLQFYNNNLTSFNITGLSNLQKIYVQNNSISNIQGLSGLSNLQILDIGNNPLNYLPDLSSLSNLKELHVHQTGIDTIPHLEMLTNLEVLYAWANTIEDLSALNSNTKLKIISIGDNHLKDLPVLNNKPNLFNVDVSRNYLTISDIYPLTGISSIIFFIYSPQALVSFNDKEVREKENLFLYVPVDTAIAGNKYKLFKDGKIIDSNNTGKFFIPAVKFSDKGNYTFSIINPSVSALEISSVPAIVSILPCMEYYGADMHTISENCNEGKNIQLTSVNYAGGKAPFRYGIVSSVSKDTTFNNLPEFSNVQSGIYQFVITDSRGCLVTSKLVVNPIEGCDPIFSPNGDGIADSYFITETGKARIYDLNRNLIKELNVPASWDGTKTDGSPAEDGYYAIVINEGKVKRISLVR